MFQKSIVTLTYSFILFCCFSCASITPQKTSIANNDHQQIFWNQLQSLCGKAFVGSVENPSATDTAFQNKALIMHVRNCSDNVIRIPFFVGADRSRTWVFTRGKDGIKLKHDHRHRDGSEDSVTQYGGHTSNSGSGSLQVFPADQFTVNMLPAAATNVWWVEVIPGKTFSYNLRRVSTNRLFTVKFDLTKPKDAPEAPWGWKD